MIRRIRIGDFEERTRLVERATIRPPIIEAYRPPVVKVIEPIAPKVTTYIAPLPIVVKPIFAPKVTTYVAPPPRIQIGIPPLVRPAKVIAPIFRPKKPIEIETFKKAITRPKTQTAVAGKLQARKFSESLIRGSLKRIQRRRTKIAVVEKSPDIKTGVVGKIAPLAVSLGTAKIAMKYPIDTPKQEAPIKKVEQKAGKLNVLDKFFLWINAFLK